MTQKECPVCVRFKELISIMEEDLAGDFRRTRAGATALTLAIEAIFECRRGQRAGKDMSHVRLAGKGQSGGHEREVSAFGEVSPVRAYGIDRNH